MSDILIKIQRWEILPVPWFEPATFLTKAPMFVMKVGSRGRHVREGREDDRAEEGGVAESGVGLSGWEHFRLLNVF